MYSRQIEARSWLLQSGFSTLLSRAATVQPTEQRRVSFQRLCARVCFNLFNYHFAGTATLAFSSSRSFFLGGFFCSFPILVCHSTSTEAWSCSHLSPRQLHQIQTNNPPQQHPLQRRVTARRFDFGDHTSLWFLGMSDSLKELQLLLPSEKEVVWVTLISHPAASSRLRRRGSRLLHALLQLVGPPDQSGFPSTWCRCTVATSTGDAGCSNQTNRAPPGQGLTCAYTFDSLLPTGVCLTCTYKI